MTTPNLLEHVLEHPGLDFARQVSWLSIWFRSFHSLSFVECAPTERQRCGFDRLLTVALLCLQLQSVRIWFLQVRLIAIRSDMHGCPLHLGGRSLAFSTCFNSSLLTPPRGLALLLCTRDDSGKAGPFPVERLKMDLPFVMFCVYKGKCRPAHSTRVQGEPCPARLVTKFLNKVPGARMINIYGTTATAPRP